jgi:hypothetical protein
VRCGQSQVRAELVFMYRRQAVPGTMPFCTAPVATGWSGRVGREETLAADHAIWSLPPGEASLPPPLLPLIFLAAVNGQRSHINPRARGVASITLASTSSAWQPPASETTATTSSRVTQSPSPVILNSTVLRGTVTLAENSGRATAIRSASRDALLSTS